MFKSKQEAAVWAWMTDTARFKAHSFQTRFGIVQLERGQLLASQRTIAEDFGLGRQQVRRLIDSMVKAGMIAENSTHPASRAGTIITIVNYERYQADSEVDQARPTQRKPKQQPITNPRPTQDQPTREKGGKGEEGEEERPSVSSPEAGNGASGRIDAPVSLSLVPSVDHVGAAFAAFEAMRHSIDPAARTATLSPDRRKKLAARLDEIGGPAAWADVLGIVQASPFLRGETSRAGRLVATIDWLLKPENLRKVREGNYDERHPAAARGGPRVPASPFDAVREARAILGRGGS
ncbi:hypothetical protein [Sphingomonas paucimobilis]|uniref:hypothetical protein n=1 Tax=Sphingomonas paucimobilis TaxID=13689 RepID=UPI0031E06B0C